MVEAHFEWKNFVTKRPRNLTHSGRGIATQALFVLIQVMLTTFARKMTFLLPLGIVYRCALTFCSIGFPLKILSESSIILFVGRSASNCASSILSDKGPCSRTSELIIRQTMPLGLSSSRISLTEVKVYEVYCLILHLITLKMQLMQNVLTFRLCFYIIVSEVEK